MLVVAAALGQHLVVLAVAVAVGELLEQEYLAQQIPAVAAVRVVMLAGVHFMLEVQAVQV
jgi:hypothetical protein